jgi:hypothetical protein
LGYESCKSWVEMNHLGFMLKSFRGDMDYARRNVESFNEFNRESLPLFLVVPKRDSELFSDLQGAHVTILADEDIPVDYLSPETLDPDLADPRPGRDPVGYLNQGIAKLGFHRLGLVNNYVVLDSDTEFIRDFGTKDFLTPDGIPFFFGQEYSDLAADPFYRSRYWVPREEVYNLVREILGVTDPRRITVHNSQVFSTQVLSEFESDFLSKNNLDYRAIMQMGNLEFFWYGAWMQLNQSQSIIQRGDVIRMVNHQGEHLALHSLGIKKKDLASSYLGVTVNSNWSRQYGLVGFDNPPVDRYLREGDWAKWRKTEGCERLFVAEE